ncbi:cellulase [Musa troglodytarum]|uniref:Endoglucanase n=1 Tax=Musa troglodytarum TaxID=320322 RepID=A0A9E7JF48_9LILI|nr:cellulase [Musa troglodytarum]
MSSFSSGSFWVNSIDALEQPVYCTSRTGTTCSTLAAFLLAVYSRYLNMADANLFCPDGQLGPDMLLKFAQSQADYILGRNPKSMSYLVGYGWNHPSRVRHRGASIPSVFVLPSAVGCIEGFDEWYVSKNGNPNVIEGALVGDPDRRDEFYDDRCKYEQTEPSIAGNAPLIGLFAVLDSLAGDRGYDEKKSAESHRTPAGE